MKCLLLASLCLLVGLVAGGVLLGLSFANAKGRREAESRLREWGG